MKKDKEQKLCRFALLPNSSQKGFLNKTEFGTFVKKKKKLVRKKNDFVDAVVVDVFYFDVDFDVVDGVVNDNVVVDDVVDAVVVVVVVVVFCQH